MNENWLRHQLYGEYDRERARFSWLRLIEQIGIAACILAICAFIVPRAARADAAFVASAQGGVVVTLYDEPCAMTDSVTNLRFRASWQEGDKTFSGCWDAREDLQAVIAFFSDKTVAVIPFQMLKRAQGA